MRIIHVLADGSVKYDLTGYKIKPDTAREFYNVLARINRGGVNEKKNQNKD